MQLKKLSNSGVNKSYSCRFEKHNISYEVLFFKPGNLVVTYTVTQDTGKINLGFITGYHIFLGVILGKIFASAFGTSQKLPEYHPQKK